MTSEFLCETLNVMNKKIVITNVQLNVSYFFGSKLTEKEPFLELKPFWLILWSITPPRTSRFPVSCSLIGCRLLAMYIQSEFISHSRFWIADRFRYLACQIFHGRQRFSSDRVWLFTLHDCHLSEWAPICLWFRAFVWDFAKPVCE